MCAGAHSHNKHFDLLERDARSFRHLTILSEVTFAYVKD